MINEFMDLIRFETYPTFISGLSGLALATGAYLYQKARDRVVCEDQTALTDKNFDDSGTELQTYHQVTPDDVASYVEVSDTPGKWNDSEEIEMKDQSTTNNVASCLLEFLEIPDYKIQLVQSDSLDHKYEAPEINQEVGPPPLMQPNQGLDDTPFGTIALTTKEELNGTGKYKKRKSRLAIPILIPQHIITIPSVEVDGTEKFQCIICSKKPFKTKQHIKYHDYCASGKKKPFSCKRENCGKRFISKTHWEYHQRYHLGERPFECTKCHESFYQKTRLNRHMKSHTKEKPVQRTTGIRQLATRQSLRFHKSLKRIGLKKGPSKKCRFCDTESPRLSNCKRHETKHIRNKKVHLCDKCGMNFTRLVDLKRHFINHSGEKPYDCQFCKRKFTRNDNLKRHVKSCTAKASIATGNSELNVGIVDDSAASESDGVTRHTLNVLIENTNSLNVIDAGTSTTWITGINSNIENEQRQTSSTPALTENSP